MLELKQINAIAQAIDSSWGTSSTPQTASYSVKAQLVGDDKLLVKFIAVVNFSSQGDYIRMTRVYAEESQRVIDAFIKNVKTKYKTLTDETLKLKKQDPSDNVEVINLGVYNPKRTAYYRSNVVFEVI